MGAGIWSHTNMHLLRLPLCWSAVLLLTFATTAMADPAMVAPQAVCDDSALATSGEGDFDTASFCHAALCESDWDCLASCPSAKTATCVQYACEYTYSTGGGGGRLCPDRLCSDDSECVCNGRYGYCGADSVCRF